MSGHLLFNASGIIIQWKEHETRTEPIGCPLLYIEKPISSVYLILLCKLVTLISLSKQNLIASSYSYLIHLSFFNLILSVI